MNLSASKHVLHSHYKSVSSGTSDSFIHRFFLCPSAALLPSGRRSGRPCRVVAKGMRAAWLARIPRDRTWHGPGLADQFCMLLFFISTSSSITSNFMIHTSFSTQGVQATYHRTTSVCTIHCYISSSTTTVCHLFQNVLSNTFGKHCYATP